MAQIILFAPLIGAILCGFGWRLFGEMAGQAHVVRTLGNALAASKRAAAHGITTRTLYRRRNRTLTALRGVAPQYLAAVA